MISWCRPDSRLAKFQARTGREVRRRTCFRGDIDAEGLGSAFLEHVPAIPHILQAGDNGKGQREPEEVGIRKELGWASRARKKSCWPRDSRKSQTSPVMQNPI